MKKLNLDELPREPGVYRFYNELGILIYIGKAKNLRRRLAQYQNAKRRKAHAKMKKIFKDAKRMEFEVCFDELQALLRETELIQAHRPKWNVVGAFYFLYPMVGLKTEDGHLYFCYTTQPEHFPDFKFHGAFRSRFRTREGFFALIELLKLIGHSAGRAQMKKNGLLPLKHTYFYGFRQIPETWSARLDLFFRGQDFTPIETLSLMLLERPSAIARSKEIQDHLHEIRNWYRHEMIPLKNAREHCTWPTYPVSQKERDLLFIQLRNSAPRPSATPESAQSTSAPSCQKVLS